jgi:glycolate oxidase
MEEVARACIEAGGALSGEHGIGLEKRDLMPLLYRPEDLDAQARLREAFDPDALFNPDKVLPIGARCADLGRPIPEGVWV